MTSEAVVQPQREDFDYDLERALSAVVGIKASVPADAFTADTLGTERAGSGVIIDDSGLVLTIGYLITEAASVWITLAGGRAVPGHVLGYDQETGFGLVQALARMKDVPYLDLGSSKAARTGERVVIAAAGGRQKAIVGRIQRDHRATSEAPQKNSGRTDVLQGRLPFAVSRFGGLFRHASPAPNGNSPPSFSLW